MKWEAELLRDINKKVPVVSRRHGAKPSVEIFHREIVRSQITSSYNNNVERKLAWNKVITRTNFANALEAVQELSLYVNQNSTKGVNIEDIDEIDIANQVAACANGERLDSFGYLWAWKENESQGSGWIHDHPETSQHYDIKSKLLHRLKRRAGEQQRPKKGDGSFFWNYYSCSMCAADTTVV
jgi:hypothetical protein